MKVLGQSITRNGLILGAFAVATAVLIAGTYLQTRERIAAEQRAAEERDSPSDDQEICEMVHKKLRTSDNFGGQ